MKRWRAVATAATPSTIARGILSRLRFYSQAMRSTERITVPCRSNEEITLDVQHPTTPHQETVARVLIYLPRGPFNANAEDENSTLSQLARELQSHHVVRINYRLGPQHLYPTPIHDALTGYDWIFHNLLPRRAISRPGRADQLGRIAVCGEFIGGGLASMLALTECRLGEPGITAAAVSNPLVDWVSLSDQSASLLQQQGDSLSKQLLDLRSALFSRPDRYFDPHASPMLLFRTAGTGVPPAPADTMLDDMAQLSLLEREEVERDFINTTAQQIKQKDSTEDATPETTQRKSSRRFPSPSLNLRLPDFHISSGSTSPFSQQAEEFAHVLRQSLIRQARQISAGSSFGRKALLEGEQDQFESEDEKSLRAKQQAEAIRRAQLHQHPQGLGLWGGSESGRGRVQEVATWLRERMQ